MKKVDKMYRWEMSSVSDHMEKEKQIERVRESEREWERESEREWEREYLLTLINPTLSEWKLLGLELTIQMMYHTWVYVNLNIY